jgi:transcriptional regulator with XRE-family HTH domain
LEKQLWEVCRDKKDAMTPRITNRQIADETGLAENTVSMYLRGETKNAPLATFGPICRILGVSVDAFIGLTPKAPQPDAALLEQLHALEAENRALHDGMTGLNAHLATCKKSLKMHRLVTAVLLAMVFLALVALVYDVLNPDVGWIRDQLAELLQRPFSV